MKVTTSELLLTIAGFIVFAVIFIYLTDSSDSIKALFSEKVKSRLIRY